MLSCLRLLVNQGLILKLNLHGEFCLLGMRGKSMKRYCQSIRLET